MQNTFYRFNLGKLKCAVISDGYLMIPEPPTSGKIVPPDNSKGHRTDISCLFIDAGKHKVLIDTGCGNSFGPTAGKLLANMQAAGLKPIDVDSIIFTHGHSDHVAGAFDKQGRAIFPHARYFISKDEWECLVTRPEKGHLTNLFAAARETFLSKPQQFELADYNTEILPGIKLLSAPGHSPGNILLEITSGSQELLCIGDIIHVDIEFQQPGYYAFLDVNPKQALRSRNAVFAQAAKSKRLLFACHFDYPGLGYIEKNGKEFSWKPQEAPQH